MNLMYISFIHLQSFTHSSDLSSESLAVQKSTAAPTESITDHQVVLRLNKFPMFGSLSTLGIPRLNQQNIYVINVICE